MHSKPQTARRRSINSTALSRSSAAFAAISGVLALGPNASAGTATIFSDDFSTSTLNVASPAALTATSTNYDVASAKNASASSIASADLTLTQPSTTSGVSETQALFTTTPVVLAATGDKIELTVTFTDTSGILTTGSSTSGALYFGLYNSGGVAPVAGLANAQMLNTLTNFSTGGVQNWLGYVDETLFTGGNSRLATRPAQNGATLTNTDQELLGNNASTAQTYDNPAGVNILSNSGGSTTLTAGNVYTEDFVIAYTGTASKVTLTNNLYAGNTVAGSLVATQTTTTSASNFLTQSFDGLAMGYRETGGQVATLDYSSLTVKATLASIVAAGPTVSLSGTIPAASNLIANVTLVGGSGKYAPQTFPVSGAASTAGYLAVSGFTPTNDPEVYGLAVTNTSTETLAQIVADLQAGATPAGATVELVSSISNPALAGLLSGDGDNLAVLFPSGSNPASATNYFAYDLSNYSGAVSVTSVTVVPEPTAISALLIGASTLLVRRRKA